MRRNALLAAGPPSHDFAALGAFVADLLRTDDIATEVVTDLASLEALLTSGADRPDLVTVLALQFTMQDPRYEERRATWAAPMPEALAQALGSFVEGGGGLLALHTACVCFDDWPGWGDLIGATWDWQRSSHDPVGPARLEPSETEHPIRRGLGPFAVDDEIYERLAEHRPIEPLYTCLRNGRQCPVVWTSERGSGRVVTDTLGHAVASLSQPTHAAILRRSARWVLHDDDDIVAGIAPMTARTEPST